MTTQGPALFFFVDGKFLLHGCPLSDGESCGDFVNYPHSHMDIWDRLYAEKYGVDFDYYPRGRVVYRKTDDTYLIYCDRCIGNELGQLLSLYKKYKVGPDEHYQCSRCNPDYVV